MPLGCQADGAPVAEGHMCKVVLRDLWGLRLTGALNVVAGPASM